MQDKSHAQRLAEAMQQLIGAKVVEYTSSVQGTGSYTGGELILETEGGTRLRVYSTSWMQECAHQGDWSEDELVIDLDI